MGRIKGRFLTVFISSDGVRVVEGENKDGNPVVHKYFTVTGVGEYFTFVNGEHEICGMTGLVEAITSECKSRNIMTRKVLVCSDCIGMRTEVETGYTGRDLKSLAKMDVKDLLSLGSEKKASPDMMMCVRNWGAVPVSGKLTYTNTRTTCDKYTAVSLVKEFYKRGYNVYTLTGDSEILLNFKQTEAASFDSRGKIIFNMSDKITRSVFVQDVLVSFESFGVNPRQSSEERILSLCTEVADVTGRRPKVYLAGPAFKDAKLYTDCMDYLQGQGYPVCDLFDRPTKPDNYEELLNLGDISPLWTADFSANVALLMCPVVKTFIETSPKIGLNDIFQSNSKAGATVALAATLLLFVGSVGTGAVALSRVLEQRDDPVQLDSLQSQVMSLSARQQSLQSTLNTLTKADPTALELLRFVIDHRENSDVRIISVDTRDMLTNTVTVANTGTGSDTVTGGTGSTGARENIVIRGYSRSGPAAIEYFDAMFNCGLPTDPVLNGIERYVLPQGEEVYVFEIEIGGVIIGE